MLPRSAAPLPAACIGVAADMVGVRLALLLQGLPTVGDTIWIPHAVAVAPDLVARPRPLAATQAVHPLGPPELTRTAGELRLRYPVVVWRPGRHRVELPGPVLVRRDGWSDTLPSVTIEIEVASVLPPGPRDSLAPRPPLAWVERRGRSLLPTLVLLLLVALPLVVAHRPWRRWMPRHRRGAREAPPVTAVGPPPLVRLREWMSVGEYRAAADGLCLWLAGAAERDRRAAALVQRLRAARYAAEDDPELARACAAAADWLRERETG